MDYQQLQLIRSLNLAAHLPPEALHGDLADLRSLVRVVVQSYLPASPAQRIEYLDLCVLDVLSSQEVAGGFPVFH